MSGSVCGTRFCSSTSQGVGVPTCGFDRTLSTDPGLLPVATGPAVFGAGELVLIGAFIKFATNDQVLIEGTAFNNGEFLVLFATADALSLFPFPKPEMAPATTTIRATVNVYDAIGVPATLNLGTALTDLMGSALTDQAGNVLIVGP